jgi:apolipoprotein N-acyltransferase
MDKALEKLLPLGLIATAFMVFFYLLIGISAAMTAFALVVFLMLPLYLILDNFDLEDDEKLVFSFFAGAGIVPSIAYWAGRFISFKIGIIITFMALIAISFIMRKLKK